jgi:hypothetical protein
MAFFYDRTIYINDIASQYAIYYLLIPLLRFLIILPIPKLNTGEINE